MTELFRNARGLFGSMFIAVPLTVVTWLGSGAAQTQGPAAPRIERHDATTHDQVNRGLPPAAARLRFSATGELIRPEDYREWVYLSSGLGMVYGPAAAARVGRPPAFTNVFVEPEAYRHFMRTGTWPQPTAMILEIRASATAGSINQGGHFQADIIAVEAAIKDRRFDGWAYFNFGQGDRAAPLPASASCYACHRANAAVDQTFVQFYPTLMEVAKRMGTIRSDYKPGAAHVGAETR
jgi:hypothetical protein